MGILLAFGATLSTAGAALLQSVGAHRVPTVGGFDPRILWGLVRTGPYVLGLGLDGVAGLLTVLALRTVPLFVVQAVVAAALAVIAVASVFLHQQVLRRPDWAAVAGVCVGLALLVLSEEPHQAVLLSRPGLWSLLLAPLVVSVLAAVLLRRRSGAAAPGLLAGLMFGNSAVAARSITPVLRSPLALARNPATYAMVLAGILGTVLYATALQRGSVTTASAMSIVSQTLGPALTGWFLLGDAIRAGFLWAAVSGFVLTVGGAVTLARHAHPGASRGAPRTHPSPGGPGGSG